MISFAGYMMRPEGKLNIALIGQGRSGRNIHGRFLKSEQDMYNVVAVVDALEKRRNRAAEEYACDVYSDYRELFKRNDIDLVVNSTFSYMHADIACDLMNNGLSVISEKPFATNVADCDRMIRASEENGVTLAVFQQSRFAPYFKKIKEIIASGKLGRIMQVDITFSGFTRRWDWQCSKRFGGGSVLNTGPHSIDQALDLLGGDEMPQVFSRLGLANTSGDAEDYAKIIITSPGKPVFDIELSSCDAFPTATYKIQGTHGGLLCSTNHADLKYYIPADEPERKLILTPLENDEGLPEYCSEKLTWHEEAIDIEGNAFTTAVVDFYTEVYKHLTEGTALTVTPAQVRRQIAVDEIIFSQNRLPVIY